MLGLQNESLSNADARLMVRAARERWPVDDVYRAATAKRMIAIALSPNERSSDAIRAARVLATFDRLNLDQERFDWERQRGRPANDYPDEIITEEMAAAMRRAALEEAERLQPPHDERQPRVATAPAPSDP